jgi:transcriptional regulator with XRE-family HTH domain
VSKKRLQPSLTKARPRVSGLRELRQLRGVTQQDLAQAAGIQQSEISRLERRDDFYLSTLQRVVNALGGKLEIGAWFGKKHVRIDRLR